MSALAITRGETPADGLMRSARLMRALGPDAAPIWAELSKSEVQALTAAMDTLGPSPEGETEAVSQFMEAHRRLRQPAESGASVWRRLADAGTETLAGLFSDEHAQTVALVLSAGGQQLTRPAARRISVLVAIVHEAAGARGDPIAKV